MVLLVVFGGFVGGFGWFCVLVTTSYSEMSQKHPFNITLEK